MKLKTKQVYGLLFLLTAALVLMAETSPCLSLPMQQNPLRYLAGQKDNILQFKSGDHIVGFSAWQRAHILFLREQMSRISGSDTVHLLNCRKIAR